MTLSNLPGPWRWEERETGWWRIHDELEIEDGPHDMETARRMMATEDQSLAVPHDFSRMLAAPTEVEERKPDHSEQNSGESLLTYIQRCGDCRREIFFEAEADRWLHWDPHFDSGRFAHEAVLEGR